MSEPLMPLVGAMPDNTGELETNDPIVATQPQEAIVETPIGEEIPNPIVETPVTTQPVEDPNKAIFESWREDREALTQLEQENREMRERLAREEANDEELSNLPEDERVTKLVERRENERRVTQEREKRETESEIRWHKLRDPFFKENEQRILKNAVDFNSKSLADAIKITKQQDELIKQAIATGKYHDTRKKEANGVGNSVAGGKIGSSYDPKVDGTKSIADLYREGGN